AQARDGAARAKREWDLPPDGSAHYHPATAAWRGRNCCHSLGIAAQFSSRPGTASSPPSTRLRRSSIRSARRTMLRGAAALPALLALSARPAGAVMDIANHGPTLDAGRFAMRVTNIGVLGNAFFNTGLSSDPSFEFPRGSGHELLNHAELWVGALDESGAH